jgi:predicted DNA binding CopG/RHH family protein
MLQTMEQQAKPSPPSNPLNFAGLLASLTLPAKESTNRDAGWGSDGLGDDVVTLTYEQALRNHSRYRKCERGDWAAAPSAQDAMAGDAQEISHSLAPQPDEEPLAQPEPAAQSTIGHELRASSVTIRLSRAECTQLRQRAAEAGLTVSAYLRSCVLEADALRAQVKEALAEMKASPQAENALEPVRKPWLGWMGRKTKRK